MVILQACTGCGSGNIVYNGFTFAGKQKFHCKDCGCYRTLGASQVYTNEQREQILRAYKERSSLRGVHRVHGVAVSTILVWLKKNSKP